MSEIEDGMGFSGLVPTKEEKYIEKLEAENKALKEIIDGYSDVVFGKETATQIGNKNKALKEAMAEAMRCIEFYGDKDNWLQNEYYPEESTFIDNDLQAGYAGKLARETKKKIENILR